MLGMKEQCMTEAMGKSVLDWLNSNCNCLLQWGIPEKIQTEFRMKNMWKLQESILKK